MFRRTITAFTLAMCRPTEKKKKQCQLQFSEFKLPQISHDVQFLYEMFKIRYSIMLFYIRILPGYFETLNKSENRLFFVLHRERGIEC